MNVVSSPVDFWWPRENSVLTGKQPFKGSLTGYSINAYDMYWKVDQGPWYKMYTSWEGGAHKEAWVDVKPWTWNGTGPYRIYFSARDRAGVTIAERSIPMFIDRPHLNLFTGASFFVDPYSPARQQAAAWATSRPTDAAAIDRIGNRSQADWFGDWYPDIAGVVSNRVGTITTAGKLPVLVVYNIPVRDCNLYSRGGAASPDAYRAWIGAFAQAIGSRKAVVILEPDGLAAMDCLPVTEQFTRMDLIRSAVRTLKAQPNVSVYIDAGNSGWQPAAVIASRLNDAGLGFADGFALNIANFHTTSSNAAFGEAVSKLVGNKRFVIDTSRNGLGGTDPYVWCNAAGRALGAPPTTTTGYGLADAFLWIKRPGESDGECAGGPSAGTWWSDYALGLAQRMPATLAAAQ